MNAFSITCYSQTDIQLQAVRSAYTDQPGLDKALALLQNLYMIDKRNNDRIN